MLLDPSAPTTYRERTLVLVTAGELAHERRDAVVVLVVRDELVTLAEIDAEVIDGVRTKHGFEEELRHEVLRLGRRPVRGDAMLAAVANLGRGGPFEAGDLMAVQLRQVHDVGAVIGGQPHGTHGVGATEPAQQFHRSGIGRVAPWIRRKAVFAVEHDRVDAEPSEIHGHRDADRAATGDQDGGVDPLGGRRGGHGTPAGAPASTPSTKSTTVSVKRCGSCPCMGDPSLERPDLDG